MGDYERDRFVCLEER
jgi:hypothetical protein